MKHHEQHARLAFNEQRALEDLQRLHSEIQRARRQREQAESEFEQFVREPPQMQGPPAVTTRPPRAIAPPSVKPAPAPSVPAPAPAAPAGPSQAPTAVPALGTAVSAAPSRSRVAGSAAETPAASAVTESAAIHAEPTPRMNRWLLVFAPLAAAAVLVAIIGPRWWRAPGTGQSATPPPIAGERAPGATQSPAPGPTQAPAAQTSAAPAPATPPEPAPPLLVEITTLRPVWLRATVDGRRLFERELPAGRQIPLRAERAVLLRAGDAGAVSVRVDGRDLGPLGRDGAVANRLFEAAKQGS